MKLHKEEWEERWRSVVDKPKQHHPHRCLSLWLLASSLHILFFFILSISYAFIPFMLFVFSIALLLLISLLKEFHSLNISVCLPKSQHISLCFLTTRTAEAIITFHPSIKHSQLWSISTLSPLHSTALNLKCLPSVSVSTYLSADKAILDSGVDDYYNRFHNAFQYSVVCMCVWM